MLSAVKDCIEEVRHITEIQETPFKPVSCLPEGSALMLQEICRSLHLDLTGQTSASYNMRLNYEKCLLDFEKYLASGRYNADLAVGTAPPTDVLEAPPTVKPNQEGFGAMASEPHNSGYSTRGASRMAAGLPPPGASGMRLILSNDLEQ